MSSSRRIAALGGVVLAGTIMIMNGVLPYYPVRAVIVILLDVLVVWALVAYEPKRAA